jgi:hypothetical protein
MREQKIIPGEREGSGTGDSNERPSKFFHSFNVFSHRDKRKKPSAPASSHKMLTSCQLSDLFRRLDKNGNGELELSEFLLIIKKLKIPVDEDYVNR